MDGRDKPGHDGEKQPFISPSSERGAAKRALAPEGALAPHPDPIAAPDPAKAHDFAAASWANAVDKTFLRGKDLSQAVKGWDDRADTLGEHAGPVIEFLKNFLAPRRNLRLTRRRIAITPPPAFDRP